MRFEDRVMFGTDQMEWPKLMAYSISIIQNADFLTPPQKRDILYNNAARLYRLDKHREHKMQGFDIGPPSMRTFGTAFHRAESGRLWLIGGAAARSHAAD
jgi:Amidohydrolase